MADMTPGEVYASARQAVIDGLDALSKPPLISNVPDIYDWADSFGDVGEDFDGTTVADVKERFADVTATIAPNEIPSDLDLSESQWSPEAAARSIKHVDDAVAVARSAASGERPLDHDATNDLRRGLWGAVDTTMTVLEDVTHALALQGWDEFDDGELADRADDVYRELAPDDEGENVCETIVMLEEYGGRDYLFDKESATLDPRWTKFAESHGIETPGEGAGRAEADAPDDAEADGKGAELEA